MGKKKSKKDEKNDSSILDDLIKRYYQKLKESEDVKVGDLLKMIELRRKLMPADSNQKQFWKMLEEVRKNNMDSKEIPSAKPKKNNEKK